MAGLAWHDVGWPGAAREIAGPGGHLSKLIVQFLLREMQPRERPSELRVMTMNKIGFVGLGSMGAPLAGRLLGGNQVYGTNRTRAKASALTEQGLIWRDTPREVAAGAQVVFSMVTDDAALAAITSGPDGILAGLWPGSVYVDMSTVSPQASRELARRVHWAGGSSWRSTSAWPRKCLPSARGCCWPSVAGSTRAWPPAR